MFELLLLVLVGLDSHDFILGADRIEIFIIVLSAHPVKHDLLSVRLRRRL